MDKISVVAWQRGIRTAEMNSGYFDRPKGKMIKKRDLVHPRVELMVAIWPPGKNLKAEVDLGWGLEVEGDGHGQEKGIFTEQPARNASSGHK